MMTEDDKLKHIIGLHECKDLGMELTLYASKVKLGYDSIEGKNEKGAFKWQNQNIIECPICGKWLYHQIEIDKEGKIWDKIETHPIIKKRMEDLKQ